MLSERLVIEFHPRSNSGQPAPRTTPDDNASSIQRRLIEGTSACMDKTITGMERRALAQKRRVIDWSSGWGADASERLGISGSSAIPHLGQTPGPCCRTCG